MTFCLRWHILRIDNRNINHEINENLLKYRESRTLDDETSKVEKTQIKYFHDLHISKDKAIKNKRSRRTQSRDFYLK